MPTLIRLIITLLFLAGLVYAGMFALVAFVEPTQKEQTIPIRTQELLNGGQRPLPGTEAPSADAPSATPTEAPATP
jgi:hypothetical protein